jgi:hypothetical protein
MELRNGLEVSFDQTVGRRARVMLRRFEAVTVRAAARVLELEWVGTVTPAEARFYLEELAEMDAHAGGAGHGSGVGEALRLAAEQRLATASSTRTSGWQIHTDRLRIGPSAALRAHVAA